MWCFWEDFSETEYRSMIDMNNIIVECTHLGNKYTVFCTGKFYLLSVLKHGGFFAEKIGSYDTFKKALSKMTALILFEEENQ